MALNYNTAEALIAKKYIPKLEDNIFLKYSPTLAWAYKNAKTFEGRKLVVPLEYLDAGNTQMLNPYDTIAVVPAEIATAAEYVPKLANASLVIDIQEEIQSKTPLAVKNLIDAKIKNVEKSMAGSIARALFTTVDGITGAMSDSSLFNSLPYLINNKTTAVGGILPTDFAGWVSSVLDASSFTDDFTIADMTDSTKDTYLLKLFPKLLAKMKFRNKSSDVLIILPQEVWDAYEYILQQAKLGSGLGEMKGVAGFDTLAFRSSKLVAEDAMLLEQTDTNKNEIYGLNAEYIYWAFSPGARMASEPFVPAQNALTKVKNFYTMGNMVTSNRAALARITAVEANSTYVNPGSGKAIQPAA